MSSGKLVEIEFKKQEPFIPDRNVALLISCSDYSKLRNHSDFGDFNDNKYAEGEIASVKEQLIKMNFQEDDIKILTDPKCSEVKDAF